MRAGGLPLGVLGSLPCPLQSVLLALLHARVAREQSGLLQGWPEVRVVLDECSGDAVRDRTGLATSTAAEHLDADVELALSARDAQRSQGRHLEDPPPQIRERVLVVDHDAALAGLDADSCDGVLAPPGPSKERISQS